MKSLPFVRAGSAGPSARSSPLTASTPGTAATGSAIYRLDVSPDGRYVADGDRPQEVNGFFPVDISTGDAPNPLWQFDGLVDLPAPTSKG
jgi:ABC-2 type transport system permease protein